MEKVKPDMDASLLSQTKKNFYVVFVSLVVFVSFYLALSLIPCSCLLTLGLFALFFLDHVTGCLYSLSSSGLIGCNPEANLRTCLI